MHLQSASQSLFMHIFGGHAHGGELFHIFSVQQIATKI